MLTWGSVIAAYNISCVYRAFALLYTMSIEKIVKKLGADETDVEVSSKVEEQSY